MNSLYRFDARNFIFIQYHHQTLKMKSYEKLPSMVVWPILMFCHKAESAYYFNILFPIYTKLLYCVISVQCIIVHEL